MRNALTFYEFRKLVVLVEFVCLCILITLFVLLAKHSYLFLLIFPAITAIVTGFIAIFRNDKAERAVQRANLQYWNLTRSAIYFAVPLCCTLVGILALILASNYEIIEVALVCVAGMLGGNAGSLAKTAFWQRGARAP